MVTLTYGSTTVTLRNPDLGDSETFDTNIMFHFGMDGTPYSYKKKLKQVLLLNFNSLSRASITAFESFYVLSAGLPFVYVDHLGQTWTARCLNAPLETITSRGSGSCAMHSMTLQLRVEPGVLDTITMVDDDGNVLTDGVNTLVLV